MFLCFSSDKEFCLFLFTFSLLSFFAVVMLHEQTATPVINSRHLASLSRHFPASVLSQEPREESSRPPPSLSHSLREDRTSSQQVNFHTLNITQSFQLYCVSSDDDTGLWFLLCFFFFKVDSGEEAV